MENAYFSRLLPELAEKSVQATIRRLHIQNKPLAAYLRNTLSTQLGTKGSLLGDPVFEPTFGWQAYPPIIGGDEWHWVRENRMLFSSRIR